MPPSRQIPLKFPESALSFEDMAITSANRAICSAIRKTDRWPYHAFCLIGPKGSGITTLARAWAAERGATYFDAETLVNVDVAAIEEITDHDLVVDNVETLRDAEILLLMLSGVKRHQTSILLTAHTPPSNWSIQSPDLNSRLHAAPLAQLPAPDEDLMRARFRRAFARSVMAVPESVEDYLVTRVGLDYSQIEHVAELLAGATGDRSLTIPLAREILGDEDG
ncbi:MAG: hypothetical protein AAFN91_15770 [Pseudomonadota bacterium]